MQRLITFNEPSLLLPYCAKKSILSPSCKADFFLSFSDSFKAVIKGYNKSINKVLVPDFYCPETLELYREFGRLVFYKTNKDLTVDVQSYVNLIENHRPEIIINYGFFGFPKDDVRIINALKKLPETLVIEDFAHKIIFAEQLDFVHSKHFYIDSIRKQFSLLGSHLVSQTNSNQIHKRGKRYSIYKTHSISTNIVKQFLDFLTVVFESSGLNKVDEMVFQLLNKIVGSSKTPASGGFISSIAWAHVDFKKIYSHKKSLIRVYREKLENSKIEGFSVPPIVNDNISYFPCLVFFERRQKLIEHLERYGIFLDSLWDFPADHTEGLNKKLYDSVMVLPLTWSIRENDAGRLCDEILTYLQCYKD